MKYLTFWIFCGIINATINVHWVYEDTLYVPNAFYDVVVGPIGLMFNLIWRMK